MTRSLLRLVFVLLFLSHYVECGVFQRQLLNKLFSNYNPSEVPVVKDGEVLNVSISLSLQQIVDLDEKQQMLVFSGWLDISWTDDNLRWNPADYGNITVLSVMSNKIWIPDIMLFNSAGDSFDPKTDVNAVVDYTGGVSYLPPGMFRSACSIDIINFPFDEQKCELKLASWTYDLFTMDLKNKSDSAQLDSYVANGEWALDRVVSYAATMKYECCPNVYPYVMIIMHLRRRTLYFIFNLVFPCILISFMCILGFTLPPDSGEKIGLEMTTMLSIIMFSQLIMGIVPESSMAVPKIGLYFSCLMIISTLAIIANVLVLIIHHRNIKIQMPMPNWVRYWVCNKLAKLLLMVNPKHSEDEKEKDDETPEKQSSVERMMNLRQGSNSLNSSSLLANVLDINDNFVGNGRTIYVNKQAQRRIMAKRLNEQQNLMALDNYDANSQKFKKGFKREESNMSDSENIKTSPFLKSLQSVLKEVQKLTQKIADDDADEDKVLEWQFAAMVIDRLCMVFFTIATVLSTVLILFTAENFFKFQ